MVPAHHAVPRAMERPKIKGNLMLKLLAAVSSAALLAGATHAQDVVAPNAIAPAEDAAPVAATTESSDTISDQRLAAFNTAMTRMRGIAEAVGTGTPTPAQQTEMAAAVEASGLGIEQFNAVSTSVSSDPVLQARLAVMNAPASVAGSVAAAVTDAEVDQFSATMVRMREIAPVAGATPTAEQQAEMASTVEASGLARNRFNAIATAVSQDEQLRARVRLADARRGV